MRIKKICGFRAGPRVGGMRISTALRAQSSPGSLGGGATFSAGDHVSLRMPRIFCHIL
jgi:hypothetical protein